ncbi:prokaryotic E2 ligase family D protein [Mucilaginibacter sp. SMC90]|uniref:prokaryotic E2 ligase family D protein n=1 Tax=Mucilaginibacter sp. SMC90 TaxID=2929803 RepID=UPI001FB3CB19|nr:prokaryotic E2 ligase family D protein [Mucilaginibacter sp. SMC90]UOE50895.1 prokaryotic E2 ligase family D protein [Mucilaginibacter sp. SMC90]
MLTNITNNISDTFVPVKALLIYLRSKSGETYTNGNEEIYVESYDIGRNGKPINAHPLSAKESGKFGEILRSQEAGQNSFLKCRGILPVNLLYLNTAKHGFAVWHTPPVERQLFFKDDLGIPSGAAKVPAMLWKGSRDTLSVFALKGNRKPSLNSPLFHAPYFNMYADGKVCMGTVKLAIDADTCLDDFIALWESYFFNSYFSHTIEGGSNCGKNIVQLWQEQVSNKSPFPEAQLIKSGKILADIIA